MKKHPLLLLLTLAGVIALGIWAGSRLRQPSPPAAVDATPTHSPALPPTDGPGENPPLEIRLLEELLSKFSSQPPDDPEVARTMLANIRREILSLPPERASQMILAFLQGGEDAPTGLDFIPGKDGQLLEAPTLRVFLLDLLEHIDPVAAAQLASAILQNPRDADEWAIALRTRQNILPGTLPENLASLHQALRNPEWILTPSQGFLHALDLAAMAGDFPAVLRLAELAEPPENEVWAEGVAVTMHRMAREFPAATLRQLNANPDFLAGQPLARADLVAYANLANPTDRQLVEERLANPQIPLEEKQKILHMLVAPGEFVHEGLFTPAPEVLSDQSEQARFKVLLDTMLIWMEQFPALQPTIREIAHYLMVE